MYSWNIAVLDDFYYFFMQNAFSKNSSIVIIWYSSWNGLYLNQIDLKMKRNISLYHFTCHLFDNRNSSFTKTFHPRFQNGFIIIFYCKTHYTNEFVFIQWSRKFKLKILLHYFLCNSWVSFANEKNFGQFQVMKLSNFMCLTSY